jgi:hypothetical protein
MLTITTRKKLAAYFSEFLEAPRPELGGLPVCPFAKRERTKKRIVVSTLPSLDSDLEEILAGFASNKAKSSMLLVDESTTYTYPELMARAEVLGDKLLSMGLVISCIHPEDPFEIEGFRTRATPFPFLLVQRLKMIGEAKLSLVDSPYYDQWRPDRGTMVLLHELLHARGAFFPTHWLKQYSSPEEAEAYHMARDEGDEAEEQLDQLGFAGLFDWLLNWGPHRGWVPYGLNPDEYRNQAQDLANKGVMVLFGAMDDEENGMIAMVCKEGRHRRAVRTEGGDILIPAHLPSYPESFWKRKWVKGPFVWRFMPAFADLTQQLMDLVPSEDATTTTEGED